jgi:hypothetical protein
LEESDIILITKADLLTQIELSSLEEKVKQHFPNHEVLSISAKTGKGVVEWMDKLFKSTESGRRIVDIDYARYAEGEAVLGWLNSTLLLHGEQINWDDFARNFLVTFNKKIEHSEAGVGHVKFLLESGSGYLVGNITGNIDTLSIRGLVGTSNEAQLIINARVGMTPESLEQLVTETLNIVRGNSISITTKAWKCLSPGYPNPTYRYNKIVVS